MREYIPGERKEKRGYNGGEGRAVKELKIEP
jgi:hypothetical protein